MFAQNVSIRLKPDSSAELSRTLEKEIILWDSEENAKAYDRGTYPKVLKALSELVEGTAEVHPYEVSNSTFHKRLPLVQQSEGDTALRSERAT